MSQSTNRRLYTALLAYTSPESIPYTELAKSLKTSPAKLQGLTGALFRGAPRALQELTEAGYTVEELPDWIGSRPQSSERSSEEPRRSPEEPSPEPKRSPKGDAKEMAEELQARRQAEQEANTKALEKGATANAGDSSPISSPGSGAISGDPSGAGSPSDMGRLLGSSTRRRGAPPWTQRINVLTSLNRVI